jgi:AcrR family transcriptional regulator
MTLKQKSGPAADRYIETAIELIAEKGTSSDVNLREISRRIGCAHTNAYNYFANLKDLLWHAMRRVLLMYGKAMVSGLDDTLSPRAYLRRMFRNMVQWPIANPGLHRFISSDPLDPDHIPNDIVRMAKTMKQWFAASLKTFVRERLDGIGLARLVDVTLAYLDGEVFNLINGRVLPGEDIAGRVVDNLEWLFGLLTATHHDGLELADNSAEPKRFSYPKLEV